MVDLKLPEATELQKLEKKSLAKYIYIGVPKAELRKTNGTEARVQLDDAFAKRVEEVGEYIAVKRQAMNENDQNQMIVSLKVDKDTKMGIVTDVKQVLRKAYALKIYYTANEKTNQY